MKLASSKLDCEMTHKLYCHFFLQPVIPHMSETVSRLNRCFNNRLEFALTYIPEMSI